MPCDSIVFLQINGQEAEIINTACDEHGIRVLTFSQPHGPTFHYEQATNISLGDQPHLRDPLEIRNMFT